MSPLVLSVPALAVVGVATWAMGSFATGTAPFFVLVFVWLGLNFPVWAVLAVAVPGTVAYVVPLIVAHQPNQVVGTVFVMMPVVVGVGVLIARQVAHQQRTTAELREANSQLQRATRWRAALMSTVAHDIRSPLASVQLALGSLADDELPRERWHQLMTAALRQTGRVRRLTAGLLDLDRVSVEGSLRLDRREVRVLDQVNQALSYLSHPDKDVQVEVDTDLTVTADSERLEQILVNLVANALGHAGPPVLISADNGANGDASSVRIQVRDFGPGVPPERVPLLFSQFASSDRSSRSVGLGLWIVRELVRAHGGDVHYEHADPGARFVVVLPLHLPGSTEAERVSGGLAH